MSIIDLADDPLYLNRGIFIMKLIPLTQGKFAQVDDEDYEYLNQWKWYAHNCSDLCYARRSYRSDGGVKIFVTMHRIIMKTINTKLQVDHKDHNGLNCQKYNLRICTSSENCRNRRKGKRISASKFVGINWVKAKGRWVSLIYINRKIKYLGMFKNEIDAALCYNEAAKKYFGEFANLNIVP